MKNQQFTDEGYWHIVHNPTPEQRKRIEAWEKTREELRRKFPDENEADRKTPLEKFFKQKENSSE